MLEKIREIRERDQKLLEKMGDPAVIRDPQQMKKLAREQAQTAPIAALYEPYRKLMDEAAESSEILENETDAELLEMAREELARAGGKSEAG